MEKENSILQRVLKAVGYYAIKSKWRQKRTIKQWAREDAARREALKQDILAIKGRVLPEVKKKGNLTVSLTTHGRRVADFAPFAICGILKQTKLPNRIVLNLDKNKWSDAELPDLIKRLQVAGLEVNYCEDVGPHTKFLPALEKYPDDVIVTIDDDIVYSEILIEQLWHEYEQSDKRTIICHKARSIRRDVEGKLLLYSQWQDDDHTEELKAAVGTLSPYGFRGVLYPPHIFSKEVFNADVYRKICPKADDIWFTVVELLDGIAVKSIEHLHSEYHDIDRVNEFTAAGSDALHFQNSAQGQNDVQLAALKKHYDL